MAKPIQIYLDSSDFSNFSNPNYLAKNPEIEGHIRLLHEWRGDRSVEIRFSAIHIMEIAHLEFEYKQEAICRADQISALCDGNCLIYLTELRFLDCLTYFQDAEGKNWGLNFPEYSYATEGLWLPALESHLSGFKTQFAKILSDEVDRMPVKSSRRKAIKRSLIKRGNLTPTAISLIESNTPEALASLQDEFPVTDKFYKEDMLLGYLKGQIPAKEYLSEVYKGFADVSNYVGWYFDKYDTERITVRMVRELGDKLIETMKTVREQIENLYELAELAGKSQEDVRAILGELSVPISQKRSQSVLDIYNDNRARCRDYGIKRGKWMEVVATSEFGSLPSIDLQMEMLEQYMIQNIQHAGDLKFRKLRRSDAADLLHLVYLPYVDFLRADNNSVNLVRSRISRFSNKVAANIKELIDKVSHERVVRGFA